MMTTSVEAGTDVEVVVVSVTSGVSSPRRALTTKAITRPIRWFVVRRFIICRAETGVSAPPVREAATRGDAAARGPQEAQQAQAILDMRLARLTGLERQKILDELYPEPPIPLAHDDAFTLLVAVLLSAQTTDERVNQVTPALFARARTPAQMAKLPVSTIQGLIRSCGLAPAKAKNMNPADWRMP